MCYSTIVLEGSAIPGENDPTSFYEIETGMGTYRFSQRERGILPLLLEEMAAFRTKAKKEMNEATARGDVFGAAVFNAAQLAYKVSMNSVYGFTGATKGFLPCVPIAASVTATGRNMIAKTQGLVETLVPGSRVVYGDSVAAYTPVIVRDSIRGVFMITIERLVDGRVGAWTAVSRDGSDDDKEAFELEEGVETWTDDGWMDVYRVIRHRAGKPMIRVLTHTGVVDVTSGTLYEYHLTST